MLLAWENEAWLARKAFGATAFEIVYPSVSILAEPPVALVFGVVDKRGTRDVAQAFLGLSLCREGVRAEQDFEAGEMLCVQSSPM